MRINPTFGLDAVGPLDGDNPLIGATKLANSKASQDIIAKEFNAVTAQYVQAAAQCSDIDTKAVERASKLLASGALDTPEAAQAAAQAIVDSGI